MSRKYIADSHDVSIMIAQIMLSDKDDISKVSLEDVLDVLDIPFFRIPNWVIPEIIKDSQEISKGVK